jgi:hypothetical protein
MATTTSLPSPIGNFPSLGEKETRTHRHRKQTKKKESIFNTAGPIYYQFLVDLPPYYL